MRSRTKYSISKETFDWFREYKRPETSSTLTHSPRIILEHSYASFNYYATLKTERIGRIGHSSTDEAQWITFKYI
jgi:hypothetical protein